MSLTSQEEAGVLINSLDFQNKISKFFGAVLQSFRSKNVGIMFNLPNISFLNKTARSLLHLVFETKGINRQKKEVVLKCFYWQTNALSGKTYSKYLRQRVDGRMIAVKRINIGMPSKDLIVPYEKRKDEFVNKTMDSLIVEEKLAFHKQNNGVDEIGEAVKKLWATGMMNHHTLSKTLGIPQQTISKRVNHLLKLGQISYGLNEKVAFSLEKDEKSTPNPQLAPIST